MASETNANDRTRIAAIQPLNEYVVYVFDAALNLLCQYDDVECHTPEQVETIVRQLMELPETARFEIVQVAEDN